MQSHAHTRPGSARNLAFGLVLPLLVCAAIEAISYLCILMVTAQSFSWERSAAEKRASVQAAAAIRADGRETTFIVPHPYLGFVYNPDYDPAGALKLHGLPVSTWGFIDDKPPVRPKSEREVVVGIFGGSVAFWLSNQGAPALLEELAKVPAWRGKQLVLVRTALGGFKQPQQLMALNYLLTLGAHFDVVINLDGFNEVALPSRAPNSGAEYPFFPREWGTMLGGSADLNRLRLVGEISYLQAWRGELAASFMRPVLAQSITANFVWMMLDRRQASLISAAQVRLSQYQPGSGTFQPYVARGPAGMSRDAAEFDRALARMWRESSLQMARVSRANGIRYFHFLQPNQYLQGSKPIGEAERKVAFLPPGNPYESAVRAGFPILKEGGAELARQGVSFHDLTMTFAGIEQALYIDNCCHVSPQGNAILGRKIGEIVRGDFERSPPR